MCDLLDLNTTFGRRHEYDTTAGTIYNCTQIKLLRDISTGFNQNTTYWLAFFVSLVSDQVFAQPLFSKGFDFSFAFYQFHATRFTATTGVNLCFNDKHIAANNVSCGCGFCRSCCCDAFGRSEERRVGKEWSCRGSRWECRQSTE